MKRFLVLVAAGVWLTASVYANRDILIDFSQLAVAEVEAGEFEEHTPTIVDFSRQAGTSFSQEERDLMRISLGIPNWEVQLTSSARSVQNQSASLVRQAPVSQDATRYAGESVLGVRVHFPEFSVNSWAMVRPPFEIPAYSTNAEDPEALPGRQFDGFGVLKNVGVVKEIKINALGRNYPNGLSIVLEDESGREHRIFMGYLNFDGWRSMVWRNPAYQEEVRNRELTVRPLYPRSEPFIKFVGLIIHRDASQEGGDVITYFKDVEIIYDQAIIEQREEIDDESVWNILVQREEERRNAELSRLGHLQVLRTLERAKMAPANMSFLNDDEEAAAE
jgi:hypothetical protein